MAAISACAVGSCVAVTTFVPVAINSLFLTTRAPNGPPRSLRTFSTAKAIACLIHSSWLLGIQNYFTRESQFLFPVDILDVEIVGVVANARELNLRKQPDDTIYIPEKQVYH